MRHRHDRPARAPSTVEVLAAVTAAARLLARDGGPGRTERRHGETSAAGERAAGTGAPEDRVLAALEALRQIRDQLDAWEPDLIQAARDGGASWAELAPALGVASRQAAERRFLRLRRTEQETAGVTGDERVLAERDRRAGDRAVIAWARTNGAQLRQLAGQITALTAPEDPAAQESLGRLHRALGEDDAAALVPLLAEAHEHLVADHTALAERITAVTEHADQVRRATQRERDLRRGAGGPGARR